MQSATPHDRAVHIFNNQQVLQINNINQRGKLNQTIKHSLLKYREVRQELNILHAHMS